jgi:type III restriction enzyme
MIKKELIINDGLGELSDDEKSSQDIILESAYNKRIELKNKYSEQGSKVNPLCLIQLPNAEAGEAKREVIEQFLSDQGITEDNGKLAIWLSDDKSDTLNDIASTESEVEFLIFKQAIDTGWDCPRAHILVKLRDIQSYTFEVQTVGRILRMPEHKHYDDESLNTGYIFTNLTSITVEKEDYNPNIIKHLKATRKKIYKPLKLPSYYKSRVDFGDITNRFRKVLDKVYCDEFVIDNSSLINTAVVAEKLKDKGLTTDFSAYKEDLIVDKSISSTEVDSLSGTIEKETTAGFRLSDNDLQDTFNQVIKENLNGFAPKRSIPAVRAAIYQWFKKYIGINYQLENGVIHIQYLFLHPKNRAKFTLLLSKATGEYKPVKKAEVKDKIVETVYDWDVKFEEYYNQHADSIVEQPLCIYEPCYLSNNRSTPEKEFEAHIETKTESIIWWFKNGVSKKDYFGVKYEENDLPHTFYPDYVIHLKSGKVFIGDTKAGGTAKEAASRAEALQAYIKNQNENGKNLIGGIIIKDPTGKWRVNIEETYNFDKNDLTNWSFFDEIID